MDPYFTRIFSNYQEITLRYDPAYRAIWCYYKPAGRPCFSLNMLKELRRFQQTIIDYFDNKREDVPSLVDYQVLHSQVPGTFSLGGDLAFFSKLIKEQNREKLLEYALSCVDVCYLNAVNLHKPMTTIALVEGTALGGGFESALSSNVLIASERAEMGFPEIRFNLFPGMGAYSFLARACGPSITERVITSGEIYSSRQLYEMGIVHRLAKADEEIACVRNFMAQHRQLANGYRAIRLARQLYNPLTYQELADITESWTDAALRLEAKDLRLIDRLVRAQTLKISPQRGHLLVRTHQDRRFSGDSVTFPLIDWSGNVILQDRRHHIDRRQCSQYCMA
ncbi:MAG: crotonase/enoyl-CoA hydratase family protein [Desulfopila sp.]